MLLVSLLPDYQVDARRAPDVRLACTHAWGPPPADEPAAVVSLRELLGEARYARIQPYLQQALAGKILMAVAAQRGEWMARGWRPNAPGLRCETCGGPTWGRQMDGRQGKYELVK
jgi:hypothetical protein